MKKIIITDTKSVDKLYEGFKRKMAKDFKSELPAEGQGKRMLQWVMKHSNLSELASGQYADQFLQAMMEEKS